MVKYKKGIVSELFSRDSKVEFKEDEALYIEGLGYLHFIVEDNNGSITLTLDKRAKDDSLDLGVRYKCKLYYYENREGSGALYSNLKDNTYLDKEEFSSFEEGDKVLDNFIDKWYNLKVDFKVIK